MCYGKQQSATIQSNFLHPSLEKRRHPDRCLRFGMCPQSPSIIHRIEEGAWLWLGTYTLRPGDQVAYDLRAEKGERMAAGFAQAGEEDPKTTFHTVDDRRQEGELAFATGLMAWKVPAGEYRLFVHPQEGPLEGLRGQVVIRRRLDAPKSGA